MSLRANPSDGGLSGLFAVISISDRREPSYVPVPLSSVHLETRVVNFTSEIQVQQKFVNKEAQPIECIYFFPVEEQAAVTEFTAELEGRTVKTQVKDKDAARKDFKNAVSQRKTAFLLEETKSDIFEVRIGHLSPGAGCEVAITYLSELPVEEAMTRLTIPTTVAPR